jgi:hypothetical protein
MLGKVTSYSLILNGDTQEWKTKITIAGSVGLGGHASIVFGSAQDYGDYDYDDDLYQHPYGISATLSDNQDVSYAQPLDAPNDDGIVFPIANKSAVVVKEAWITGRPPGAAAFTPNSYITLTNRWRVINPDYTIGEITTVEYVTVPNGYAPVQIPYDVFPLPPFPFNLNKTQNAIVFYPITQFYLELKNLQQSFATEYVMQTSKLSIPNMVNLEAASLP